MERCSARHVEHGATESARAWDRPGFLGEVPLAGFSQGRDASSITLPYLPLHFHVLHQVDPGVVLGKLEYLPRSTHERSSTSQDNPETT